MSVPFTLNEPSQSPMIDCEEENKNENTVVVRMKSFFIFWLDEQRYAVQVSDTTMLNRITSVC
jgi:hypothetical protein